METCRAWNLLLRCGCASLARWRVPRGSLIRLRGIHPCGHAHSVTPVLVRRRKPTRHRNQRLGLGHHLRLVYQVTLGKFGLTRRIWTPFPKQELDY